MGQGQQQEVHHDSMPDPTLWSQQPHTVLRAAERAAESCLGKKDLGVAAQMAVAEQKPAVSPGG